MEKQSQPFQRKDKNCTSFYYILCGEALTKVEAFRKDYYNKTQSPIGYKAAINLMLLDK